ncbi:hypothetical protein [Glutamicibacter sp. NPDC087583]|uniref:hypothetical protein n=1 Tax=Glutamicibacter sp. NPDC087583 TaxID=3363995 RepID=UPI00364060FF
MTRQRAINCQHLPKGRGYAPARARDVVNQAPSARAVPPAETDFHNQFQEVIGA